MLFCHPVQGAPVWCGSALRKRTRSPVLHRRWKICLQQRLHMVEKFFFKIKSTNCFILSKKIKSGRTRECEKTLHWFFSKSVEVKESSKWWTLNKHILNADGEQWSKEGLSGTGWVNHMRIKFKEHEDVVVYKLRVSVWFAPVRSYLRWNIPIVEDHTTTI